MDDQLHGIVYFLLDIGEAQLLETPEG